MGYTWLSSFLFNSTSTTTSPSLHSTLSFLLLSCTLLFSSSPVFSPLNERAVPQPFLVLKRAFLLLSNWSLPSDTKEEEPHPLLNATPVSPGLSWLGSLPSESTTDWFLMESMKDWHHGAVQRKLGGRNRSLSLAICVALDQAGLELSYL